MESVILTETINTLEGQGAALLDIPRESLSANMDDRVQVVFRGMLAELMVMDNPALYRPFVSDEKRKLVLYIRLQNALCGCLKSALLFYEKLVGYLETYWFIINPYDPCVANKMVGGKQFTVFCKVYNLKISFVKSNKVTKMIQWIES